MGKKVWYEIEIRCIKDSVAFSMRTGETQTVAKVKSYGLAYVTAQAISNVYKDTCTVTIK